MWYYQIIEYWNANEVEYNFELVDDEPVMVLSTMMVHDYNNAVSV
jgi:hypothetical protein